MPKKRTWEAQYEGVLCTYPKSDGTSCGWRGKSIVWVSDISQDDANAQARKSVHVAFYAHVRKNHPERVQ